MIGGLRTTAKEAKERSVMQIEKFGSVVLR
jgi:hypothetical protein